MAKKRKLMASQRDNNYKYRPKKLDMHSSKKATQNFEFNNY